MQYREDAKTGNKLSVLGFGCMRLPRSRGGIDIDATEKMVLEAVKNGVNYFDTAYIYTGSEAALGTVLRRNNLREKVYIATKLPIVNCHSGADFDTLFAAQLQSLQTGYVDYYLVHNINTYAQWQQLCGWGIEGWIKEKKQQGAIRQMGFSFHGSRPEFEKILDAYDWDFCQIQYNYSDENYQAGVQGLRRAAAKGMPVIIMEPLLGGKLANGLPPKAEAIFKAANPARSAASWGLRWVLNQPEATVVLSGMGTSEQVRDNLQTAETALPGMLTQQEKAAYTKVVQIFRASDKVACTGCGYCMPCPKGINIPGCFSSYNASYSMGRFAGFFQYITSTAANRDDGHTASECIKCGQCEKHCPQQINIRKELGNVSRRMEPFYFGLAMSVMKRRNKKQP